MGSDSESKVPTEYQTLGEMTEFEYALPQSAPISKIVPIPWQKLLFGDKADGSSKNTDIRTLLTYQSIGVSLDELTSVWS